MYMNATPLKKRKKRRLENLDPPEAPRWNPHKYQLNAVTRGLKSRFHAFFLDPGLGKTTIVLRLSQIFLRAGDVKGVLVVAPLRPCFMVWPTEIKKWVNFKDLTCAVIHAEGEHGFALTPGVDIHVINPEGLAALVKMLKKIPPARWPFNMLVVDESTKFKDLTSVRFSLLRYIIPKMRRRYILSGTPTPNSLQDIQAQLAIVDMGETFGLKKGFFRMKYFTQFGKPEHKRFAIASAAHEEMLYRKASKYVMRLSSKDGGLKLPRRVDNKIFIELPRKARKLYDQIEKEYFAVLGDYTLLAEMEAQLRMKLHQIANGKVYADLDPLLPDTQERIVLDVHRAKLDALHELRDELGGKPILIGYNFKHDLMALQKEFGAELTTMKSANMAECQRIERDWNAGKIDLLACYPGSAALGLNLQQCGQDVFWYSLINNWEDYHQYILRIERQGSKHDTVRNHVPIMLHTLDEPLYANLQRKHGQSNKFLDRVQEYRRRRVAAPSLP